MSALKATIYTWEGGKDGLAILRTKEGKLENKYGIQPKMVHMAEGIQILEIRPDDQYVRKELLKEEKKIKKKQKPHWPEEKLCYTYERDGIMYYVISPRAKFWILQEGYRQFIQIVKASEIYVPPEPPKLSTFYL